MKILPLTAKKAISKQLHKPGFLTALILGFVSFLGGLGGMIFYAQHGGPGEAREKIVLQEKVNHLLDTYRTSQSMHLLVEGQRQGKDYAFVLPKAQETDKALRAAFEAEAKETGIALAHARQLSPNDEYALYKDLGAIQPLPDYFLKTKKDDNAPILPFRHVQSAVMNRPGFKPTLETAREIIKDTQNTSGTDLKWIFGPLILTLAGIFGYWGARRSLDKSIEAEEEAIRRAEEATAAAEEARAQADAKRQADEAAAQAAERERIAKLPPSVELDRDVSVRQIKLAPKTPSNI